MDAQDVAEEKGSAGWHSSARVLVRSHSLSTSPISKDRIANHGSEISVINISAARLVLVIKGQWDLDESWTYDPMLAVETAEIGATLIALSVPGLKPIVDRLLGRDSGIQSSSSPYRRTGSSPSIDTALSVMRAQRKSRGQHHSVLASQSAGSSDPGSMAGTTSETADKQTREGIFVQVDVNVKENYPNDRDEGAKTETAISRGI